MVGDPRRRPSACLARPRLALLGLLAQEIDHAEELAGGGLAAGEDVHDVGARALQLRRNGVMGDTGGLASRFPWSDDGAAIGDALGLGGGNRYHGVPEYGP